MLTRHARASRLIRRGLTRIPLRLARPCNSCRDGRDKPGHAGAPIMEPTLPLIWAGIIGFAVAMYVILDGFDLGIGILFPFARGERERDRMLNSIAPFWDGNETWLVLGGGGLLA